MARKIIPIEAKQLGEHPNTRDIGGEMTSRDRVVLCILFGVLALAWGAWWFVGATGPRGLF